MAFQRTTRVPCRAEIGTAETHHPTSALAAALPLTMMSAVILAVATSGPLAAQELPASGTLLPTPALPASLLHTTSGNRGSSPPARVDLQSGSVSVAPSVSISNRGFTAQSATAHATPPPSPPAPSPSEGKGVVPDQVGYASWYGSRFHGRLTASGQVYNMDELTAAHRTLPFGTKVRVTDLGNGRSVVVTINDRGPFVAGRIIDLSRAAAEAIGLTGQGVAKVRLHVLALGDGRRIPVPQPVDSLHGAPSAPPLQADGGTRAAGGANTGAPAAKTGTAASSPDSAAVASAVGAATVPSVVVQVGAFRDLANAVRLKELLSANGFSPIYEKWQDYTRVVLVPVAENDLASVRHHLEKLGISSVLVRHD